MKLSDLEKKNFEKIGVVTQDNYKDFLDESLKDSSFTSETPIFSIPEQEYEGKEIDIKIENFKEDAKYFIDTNLGSFSFEDGIIKITLNSADNDFLGYLQVYCVEDGKLQSEIVKKFMKILKVPFTSDQALLNTDLENNAVYTENLS